MFMFNVAIKYFRKEQFSSSKIKKMGMKTRVFARRQTRLKRPKRQYKGGMK